MAVNTNATYLTNLVDPEVIGNLLDRKLFNAIKFAPLCTIDQTLVGQPGSTIKMPYWKKIAVAEVTPEGQAVTINKLESSTLDAQIKKYTNGVEITDESVLSGYGDVIGQAVQQLAMSIADAIDTEIIAVLDNTVATKPVPYHQTVATSGKVVSDDIADALVLFGEDIEGDKVLLVAPADYTNLRKTNGWISGTELGADMLVKGVVGMIHGCQVVVSNRVTAGSAYIVKPNALTLVLKRDTIVESDRDIVNKSTVITSDKHAVAVLTDSTKTIKLGTF